MNFKKFIIIVPLMALTFCGKPQQSVINISGTVTPAKTVIDDQLPLLVAITKDSGDTDVDNMENRFADSLLKIVSVDMTDYSYSVDLSEVGISPGEKVNVFAFADRGYDGGMPTLGIGDYVGFYVDTKNYSSTIEITEGSNSNVDIDVKRKVYDFDATVSGSVTSDDNGELTIIAYAGEITSSDFSKLDFDGVIGYKKIKKSDKTISYSMKILPYGYNVPIKKVYLLAMLDKNSNGKIDDGDIVTYFKQEDSSLPSLITINLGS